MTIRDILEELAADLEEADEVEEGDAIAWLAGGRVFAVATDRVAEFALDPLVAQAALRTSGVSPSGRGLGWVLFAPAMLDDAAVDRAEAWLRSAWRLAVR